MRAGLIIVSDVALRCEPDGRWAQPNGGHQIAGSNVSQSTRQTQVAQSHDGHRSRRVAHLSM